jgi:hypothetical protein
LKKRIGFLEEMVNSYEQSADMPIHWLLSIKKMKNICDVRIPFIYYMTEEINYQTLIAYLTDVRITERGKRQIGSDSLQLMTSAELKKSVTVAHVNRGINNISLVTSTLFWVNDSENLVLTDTMGRTIGGVRGIFSTGLFRGYGVHTINGTGDLIYISRENNIKKISLDGETHMTLILKSRTWDPISVYSSPSSGNLLIGLWKYHGDGYIGKIVRCDMDTEEEVQSIQYSSVGQNLYSGPIYITENGNGDIVVSDYGHAVVVTDFKGKCRFSYTGTSGTMFFQPRGICTDNFLRILVCDDKTNAVQILSKDGLFLSFLLMDHIDRPRSLSYDVKTHFIWVGSAYSSNVYVYKYFDRKDYLRGNCHCELQI